MRFITLLSMVLAFNVWAGCNFEKEREVAGYNPKTSYSYGQVIGQVNVNGKRAGKPVLLSAAIKKGNRNGQKVKRVAFFLQNSKSTEVVANVWADDMTTLAEKAASGNPIVLWKNTKPLDGEKGKASVAVEMDGNKVKNFVLELDSEYPANEALGPEKKHAVIPSPDWTFTADCGACCS